MLHEGDDPSKPDRNRFAYVAFPVAYPKHNRIPYIFDENNTMDNAVLPDGANVTTFPRDPAEAGWTKVE